MSNDGKSASGKQDPRPNVSQGQREGESKTFPADELHSWLPSVPFIRIDSAHSHKDPMHLPPGELYGDFFVRQELGRGAFGVVYLAEQLSLKRTVALKVTDSRDDGCIYEGQTMAQLEHPSIVRVYWQSTDEVNKRRLLCMQYVPGMNLRTLLKKIRSKHGNDWNGSHLLEILNEDDPDELVLSETSLSDRQSLLRADKTEAICWIGAQAALALDHAHRAGYIHRDVKPENTIFTRLGRPMLVDFNLAMMSQAGNGAVGGTILYMSPESIADFVAGKVSSSSSAFDADTYSLGVVLWELAGGTRPFTSIGAEALDDQEDLNELFESRRSPTYGTENIKPLLAKTLQRAIEFQPDRRYETASEFAETLEGVAQQEQVYRARSAHGWLGQSVCRRPIAWLVVATFLPHVVSSGLQIAYNQAEIVSRLTPSAVDLFYILIYSVNPIVYGFCALVFVNILFSALKPWFALTRSETVDDDEVSRCRQESLRLPRQFAVLGALGWLIGAVVFPGIIYWFSERFSYDVWIHFICSFGISGAIAVTFGYAMTLAVIVYGIYPTFFVSPYQFAEKAEREIGPLRSKWATMSLFAGLIPLAAAILVIANFQPEELVDNNAYFSPKEFAFKSLVVGLILASTVGFALVRRTGNAIIRFIEKCTQSPFGESH